ncbi:uncharacterized protein LOC121860265 [Homarus americanus]|uniref:uncharacterized protein LOC121860265 n=1 Tax=Homarus americanus TaxID=6706 RepID=UPI001C48F1EC|nr:uncharacterized protein LOC121860265 [Homarus americanus]
MHLTRLLISQWKQRWRLPATFPMLPVVTLTAILPLVCSLVTYTFVSLPDNSIALNQNGALLALLVLLKIFVIGATGRLPIDLNKLFSGRRSRRDATYVDQEDLVEDLPCTVRILCELETAARTAMDDLLPDADSLHHDVIISANSGIEVTNE